MPKIRVRYSRSDIEVVRTQYDVLAEIEGENPGEFIALINVQNADAISDLVCDGSEIEFTQVGQEVIDTEEYGASTYPPATYETI